MNEEGFNIYPIGVVRCAIGATSEMPKDGVTEAKIEIFEKYLPALCGLEKFSHIYLTCFFHKSDRTLLKLDRERILLRFDNCDDAPLGVFASRSPSRPNPLSLTVVKVKAIKDNIIEVSHCDAIDGTPVVDIKPYNGGIDRFMNLSFPACVPKKYEMKIRWIKRIIENVTGENDAISSVIARIFADAFQRGYHYNDKKVKIAVSNIAKLIDSAIFLADATFSSRRLSVVTANNFEITFIRNERSLKYSLAIDYKKIGEIDGLDLKKNCELFDIIEECREI